MTSTPPAPLWARFVAALTVLVCGVAGALLWHPASFLMHTTLGLPRAWLDRLNFLALVFPNHPQFALVVGCLLAAGLLLAVSTARVELAWDRGDAAAVGDFRKPRVADAWRALPSWMTWALGLLLAAQLATWAVLLDGYYHWLLLPLWIVSLAAFGMIARQAFPAAAARLLTAAEVIFLLVLCLVFTVYCSLDLNHWRYSFMGDEMGFWAHARLIVEQKLPDASPGIVNPFTQEGVGGYHPMLSSIYQSWFLRVLGVNNFAWRFSSVVAAALSIPGFYLFLRELFGREAAIAGAVLWAGNHFLITYAHHGLNNVQVVAPALFGLGLGLWALRRVHLPGLYGAGVAAGIGFYTFYSSRLTLGFILLAFALVPRGVERRSTMLALAAFLFGFCVTVLPLAAAPGNLVGEMLHQTVMRDVETNAPAAGPWARIGERVFNREVLRKWEACWIDPLYSFRTGRFMSGSWVDSWTGAFFLVGVVVAAIKGWRQRILLWLAASYLVAVLAVGVATQHAYPPDTRMLFVVPFYVAFAVLALLVLRSALGPTAGRAIGIFLLGLSLAANQYRHRVETPAQATLQPFGLVVRAAQTYPPDRTIYFIAPPDYDFALLHDLAGLYGFRDRLEVVRTDAVREHKEQLTTPATLLLANMFPDRMDDVFDMLRTRYPQHTADVLHDGPRQHTLRVLDLPAAG